MIFYVFVSAFLEYLSFREESDQSMCFCIFLFYSGFTVQNFTYSKQIILISTTIPLERCVHVCHVCCVCVCVL